MKSRSGRRQTSEGRSQKPEARTRWLCAILAAGVVLGGVGGCQWLLGLDTNPPTCRITSPADSSSVSGLVTISATASDSVAVERVEFYADGALVGTDSSGPYSASWDAAALAEGTWHSLSCIAYDLEQNKGYSDTVAVVIAPAGERSVYHGELIVSAGTARSLSFTAKTSDTLAGDVRVVSGGTLTKFAWLDSVNYRKFASSQPYTAVYETDNFVQVNVNQAVPAAGKYYLAFANGSTAAETCWVRFVLE